MQLSGETLAVMCYTPYQSIQTLSDYAFQSHIPTIRLYGGSHCNDEALH